MVGDDLAGCTPRSRPGRAPVAFQARGSDALASEFIAVAFDAFLLAIHIVNVVAKEQMQIFLSVAWKFKLDRIELKQQIVSEGAHQGQSCVFLGAKFFD